MMYAIIETGGKQLKVEVGQEIFVEKLGVEPDSIYTFDKVLAIEDGSLKLGNPYLKGAEVKAKVIKNDKDKKIVIYKYKQKKGSTRRKQGHRQPYTKLVIETIGIKESAPKAPKTPDTVKEKTTSDDSGKTSKKKD